MNKTRNFEDVLDECLERLLVKHETMEQCLQSFPQYSERLRPLLQTALASRHAAAIQPAPQFKERARQQFKTALREKALQQSGRQKSAFSLNFLGWQHGWTAAVAVVLVISLAGGGTVYAAAGSMPDSPLYSVKIATEQVRLVLTFSELGKAELNAKLADKRVGEIIYLAEADKPEKMTMITQNLNNHLIELSALVSAPEVVSMASAVEKAVVAQEAPAPQAIVVPTTSPQKAPSPPQTPAVGRTPDTKPEEEPTTNLTLARGEYKKSSGETSEQGEDEKKSKEDDQKADKRSRLKTKVESQANSNNARLRAALEKASESSKPALQKALSQSETEYKKAIEALRD